VVNPVIVALDVAEASHAVHLAGVLAGEAGGFKVGLELLSGPGPATIGAVAEAGRAPVFVDAKLHDIPATVGRAARRLGSLGARWLSVHASGGRAMLEAAVEGLAEGSAGRDAGVLAVTVLTSLDQEVLREVGITESPGKLTSKMARLAADVGCEGVVCSPKELGVVLTVAPQLVRVTPGIRPAGSAAHDQKRIATPQEALSGGATFLVVGRPITASPDPVAAIRRIVGAIGW
jgi:orotidine-5'-phosphate decarboxylase